MKKEDRYDSLFQYYGDLKKVDWLLLKAQVKAESNFDPDAISWVGAKGLAQFMNRTYMEWHDGTAGIGKVEYPHKYKLIDPRDPEDGIFAQASFMSHLLKSYKGDIPKTLAAYNWGPGNVSKWIKGEKKRLPDETSKYIKRVMRYLKKYEKEVLV